MRVLDLFSGLGGFSAGFKQRGHEVWTLDLDPRFGCDFTRDILKVRSLTELEPDAGASFDVVLASPPCEAFSVASIGHHWQGGHRAYQPKTEHAWLSMKIMRHTFWLIDSYCPTFWVVENPRGLMRKLAPKKPSRTVWYCRFGDERAKPTDLWGGLPEMEWPDACFNGNPNCHHERAPRGAKTGTQGLGNAADRALVPLGLSLALAEACETRPREQEMTLFA